jgi:acyl-coenzyme A thioesterase PaaI-like protein
MDFNKIVENAKTSSFGMWKLNFGLHRFIPFNKPHGIRIAKITEDSLTTIIPKRKVNHNHIKGIHACGMATCAEFCTGLVLLYKLGMKNYRLIMESLEIKFHYQAKTDITAYYEFTDEMVKEIKATLEKDGVTYKKCEVKLHDTEGNLVATCYTNWQIKDWKKVKTKV